MSDGAFHRDEFLAWKHHPATKKYARFLNDYSEKLRASFEEHWLAGMLPKMDEAAVRGRIVMCKELMNLAFEDIETFYKQEEPDETKTAADEAESADAA